MNQADRHRETKAIETYLTSQEYSGAQPWQQPHLPHGRGAMRSLVSETAARQIQEMIRRGDYRRGEKLPGQRALSEQMGISRASLREALLTLEAIGLLRTEVGRGTFVTTPSPAGEMTPWRYSGECSLEDVFQTRLMLEPEIARNAAGHFSSEHLKRMDEANDIMESSWAEMDLLTHVEADLAFHAIIVDACSNPLLRAIYHTLRDRLTDTQRNPIAVTDPNRMRDSITEHRKIALAAPDPERIAREMALHIRNTARCAGVVLGS